MAGLDIIMVGDSLGNVIQGHDTTLPVSIEDMTYHTSCVANAKQDSLLIADMPFMTYASTELALMNATMLMQAGAEVVKLEGGAWLCDTIRELSEKGIPVCAHLGLTPQSVHQLGGFKVQGRNEQDAKRIIDDATAVEKAGARLLVLECIPFTLAAEITQRLTIPTIGIGAGLDVDGQVLVLYDMLGMIPGKPLKFAKNFLAETNSILEAIQAFVKDVTAKQFPTPEQSFE